MSEKKKYREIATVRKNPETGKVFMVFDKRVKITIEGKEVDLGEYGTVFLKPEKELKESLDFLLEKEYITADQHEERTNKIAEKNIKYGLNVPLK